jgi:hypothetical protein
MESPYTHSLRTIWISSKRHDASGRLILAFTSFFSTFLKTFLPRQLRGGHISRATTRLVRIPAPAAAMTQVLLKTCPNQASSSVAPEAAILNVICPIRTQELMATLPEQIWHPRDVGGIQQHRADF